MGTATQPSTPGSDLAIFASLFSDIRGLIQGPLTTTSIPVTPSSTCTAPSTTSRHSPAHPTPSQLKRFLHHCEDDLGILNVMQYESPLRRKSYGPDILHKVDDKALEDIGISAGNVIRLKDAAIPWYNGPSAKRRRILSEGGEGEVKKPLVAYEKRWFDETGRQTGASRFWGPPMEGGDEPTLEDRLQIWYKCEARQDWFIIPRGYAVVEEGGNLDDPFN